MKQLELVCCYYSLLRYAFLTAGYYNQTNFNNNDGGLDDPTGAEDLYYVTANLAIANTTN